MTNPVLRVLFAALEDAAVPWVVLRGHADLDRPRGDVDVLVSAAGVGALHDAAVSAGFAPWRAWRTAGQHSYFGFDADGDCWLRLHVTDRVCFGRAHALVLPVAGACLARRTLVGEVPGLHPADELWMTLLHGWLDKSEIDAKHHGRLADLAAQVQGDAGTSPIARALWGPSAPDVAQDVLGSVGRGRWDELEAFGAALRRRTRRRVGVRARELVHLADLQARRVLREPLRARGVCVALLAPDGAGKSTLAAALRTAFPIPARVMYLGLYGASGPDAGPGARGAAERLRWLAVRRARAWWYRSRRWIVVLDRHPCDALITGRRAGRLRLGQRAQLLVAPRPDAYLVLDAPSSVLLDRKQEHDAARLDWMRRRYLQFASASRAAEVLDATESADQVRRRAVAAIWARQAASIR